MATKWTDYTPHEFGHASPATLFDASAQALQAPGTLFADLEPELSRPFADDEHQADIARATWGTLHPEPELPAHDYAIEYGTKLKGHDNHQRMLCKCGAVSRWYGRTPRGDQAVETCQDRHRGVVKRADRNAAIDRLLGTAR